MTRLASLREQIGEREAEMAKLEDACAHASDVEVDRLALALDQCSDELYALRCAAEDIEGDIAMHRGARDRAWHQWRTL